MGKRTVIQCDLATCGTQADIEPDDSRMMIYVPGWLVVNEMPAEPAYDTPRLTFCSWEHLTLYGVSKKAEA